MYIHTQLCAYKNTLTFVYVHAHSHILTHILPPHSKRSNVMPKKLSHALGTCHTFTDSHIHINRKQ